MDQQKISVALTGPAKIDGQIEPTGTSVWVTPKVARELQAGGALPPDLTFDAGDTPLASDFDQAVADKAQVLAETMITAAVAVALGEITAERDTLVSELKAARGDLASLTAERDGILDQLGKATARIAELEAAAAKSGESTPAGDTPGEEPAAKPATKTTSTKARS